MRGSLQGCDKFEEIKSHRRCITAASLSTDKLPSPLRSKCQRFLSNRRISAEPLLLCVDKNVTLRRRDGGPLPLIEWTSGSPVVSQSLLRARWSSADCSSPPEATPHTHMHRYRWALAEGLLLMRPQRCGWAALMSQLLYNPSSAARIFTSSASLTYVSYMLLSEISGEQRCRCLS